jgi:hypothetical protein
MQPMNERSRTFLIEMFTDLRDQRQEELCTGRPSPPDPVEAGRHVAYYQALIAGLAHRAPFPEDPGLREFVGGMARDIDEENEYEAVLLEHRACAELIDRLPA